MRKKHVVFLLALSLALSLLLGVPAAAAWDPAEAGVALHSRAVYLVNTDTGTVIYEQNADEVRRPASLTKMMTVLLFLESDPDLSLTVTVPDELQAEFDHILKENGADVGMKTGEQMTLKSLLYSAVMPSANDATTMLAWYLSDGDLDAFYDKMNARAAELGCENTHFICCHGLYETPEGNWSTAKDIAKIAAACAARPDYMEVASTYESWLPLTNAHPTAKYVPGLEVPDGMWLQLLNTNRLLNPEGPVYRPYAAGVKTGYTDDAANCFATTATVGDTHFMLVELGCPPEKAFEDGTLLIYKDTVALLDWATEKFTYGEAVDENTPLASLPVVDCPDTDAVEVYPAGSVPTLLDGGAVRYEPTFEAETLQAPVAARQKVGTAAVFVNDKQVGTVNLVVKTDCAYSGFLHFKNTVRNWWNKLWGKG